MATRRKQTADGESIDVFNGQQVHIVFNADPSKTFAGIVASIYDAGILLKQAREGGTVLVFHPWASIYSIATFHRTEPT